MQNRRNFLTNVAATAACMIALPMQASTNTIADASKRIQNNKKIKLGIAGYTLTMLSVDDAINVMKTLEITELSLKDSHLPIHSSDEELKIVKEKFTQAGINIYACGVIYMNSNEEIDKAFEYTKKLGVNLMVGVPKPELLSYAEKKVKEYNIRLAIHNHGPEDLVYPGSDEIYNKIKDMDSRMGICLDIGHTQRLGIKPEDALKKHFNRIFDIHIKDVDKEGKDGKTIEMGRGVIDLPAFTRMLFKLKYEGVCSFEYEKNRKEPLPGLSEYKGYMNGILTLI